MGYRKVSMIEIKEILTRIAKGQSKRRIRRELSVHGLTINRYIEEARRLGINPEECMVSDITDTLCSAIAQNTNNSGQKEVIYPRDIILLPHKERIEKYLKAGLTKAKIRTLLGRDGVKVTESSFLRFVNAHFAHLRKNITVRLPETNPGQYVQADFGRLGKLYDEVTKRVRIAWAYIITLAFSRHMYVYITFRLDVRSAIEALEAAWEYFEGITEIVIIDNRPLVDKADRYNPKINRIFLEYAQKRGFIVDPTNTYHARGKPIVENSVGYVKDSFFAGEKFISRQDCQERAIAWCSHVAAQRIHGTTRQKPIELFEAYEKDKLAFYDGSRYDTPYQAFPVVHGDHHIAFKKSLYSLPTRYIGKTVEVKGDSALVRIYFNNELVKTHPRVPEGKRSTDFNDYPAELTPYTLRNADYQISQGTKRHPAIGEYISFLLSGSYPWHRIRSAQGLLRIADKYGHGRTAAACTKAKEYGVYDIRRIERMLKNGVEKDILETQDEPNLLKKSSKFARSGEYFKNYK
jgi:hypothetical protein